MTAEQRLLSGRAWDDFCDQLKLAGRAIERFGDEPDAQDRAEFYRFLTRLVPPAARRAVALDDQFPEPRSGSFAVRIR